MKVCIVSSCGGHLTEVRRFLPAYSQYEHFYVLNDQALLPPDMQGRTHYIAHSERDWRFLLNLWEAWCILRTEKPDVILSTGAGPVVPFALIGRLCFRTKVIFVETIARIESPSLTGRFMYFLAHKLYYQWPSLAKAFPRGIYGGPLL
jgi:UDP-N-acetylglucosamine:LPS N-acetylglucosamine transferase